MEKVNAGELSEFPVGAQKSIEFGDDYVLVLRSISGFWAIEDRCSHDDNELLGGSVTEHENGAPSIKCLRHGAQFALDTGKTITIPPYKPVKTYTVLIEGTTVWVTTKSER
jgi:3-phenylpropionate/trans-cinnamate dioxygenase ferredoxin subunit